MPIIPEKMIHKQIIKYLRDFNYFFFHIQNERTNLTQIQVFNRYQMGVTAGVPDICVLLKNGKSLFIEVKSTNGRLTQNQKNFHLKLKEYGHDVIIVRDLIDLIHYFKNGKN